MAEINGDASEPVPACGGVGRAAQSNLEPLAGRIAAVLMEILSAFANDLKMTQREHAELGAARIVAAVRADIDGARTVTTVEQLDALPTLAIVRDEWTSAAGWHHSGIWERRGMSWHCIAAPVMPPGHPRPALPARVLYTPERDR